MVDEGGDVGAQGRDAAMDAAPDLALGDQSEEALDLIEPGCAGRGEVDVPARSLGEPVADQRGLVGGVVVHDQMHVEIGGNVRLRSRRGTCGTRWRGGGHSICR